MKNEKQKRAFTSSINKKKNVDFYEKILSTFRKNPFIENLLEKEKNVLGLEFEFAVDTETGEFENEKEIFFQQLKNQKNKNQNGYKKTNKKGLDWKQSKFRKEK